MTERVRVSEAAFQDQVVELAHVFGWLVAHFRPCRTKHGWVTPVAADGKGFPDLVLVRPRDGRVVVAELKSEGGRLSVEQRVWVDAFEVGPVPVFVWRPSDWDEVVSVLR